MDIVGIGRAGSSVADGVVAWGMRLLAHDHFACLERARAIVVELYSLTEVFADAYFVTIHVPKTPYTPWLVGRRLLENTKPGIRIVNTERGGIVYDGALHDALASCVIRRASCVVRRRRCGAPRLRDGAAGRVTTLEARPAG